MKLRRILSLFRAADFGSSCRVRLAARSLPVAVLVAFLSWTSLVPATAHDVLVASEPGDGSVVTFVPTTVRLTLNNTPVALGSEILVRDGGGTNQSDGPVTIVDNHVTQAVKPGAPAGRYTVLWRVVSSDSHPIEGQFSFTASRAQSAAAPGTAAALSSPAAPARKPATEAGFPWLLAAGGTVMAVGLLMTGLYVRRRLPGGDRDAS
jgi:methionine-rich copper-binding protein CopC